MNDTEHTAELAAQRIEPAQSTLASLDRALARDAVEQLLATAEEALL